MTESEQQQILELDEQEVKLCLHNKEQKKKMRIKEWEVFCKLRGRKSGNEGYERQMQQIGSFNNISDFFKLHTGIKEASDLQKDIKLMYFLKGCEPLWQKWLHSGCLLFYIKYKECPKDKLGSQVLNKTWEFLLYSLIGNSLPSTVLHQDKKYLADGKQSIIGIILSRRQKMNLIEIWFRSEKNSLSLGRKIEADVINELKLIPDYEKSLVKIGFKLHRDSYHDKSTIKGSHALKGLNSSF